MTPAAIIATKPTAGVRRAAWLVAAALALASGAAAPFADRVGPTIDWYLPAVCAAVVLVNLVTCYLLFGQFVVSGAVSSAILAGGYLFSAVIAAFYLMSFPGIGSGGLWAAPDPQASGWIWIAWHAGLPLASIAYAMSERRRRRTRPEKWLFGPAIAYACAALVVSVALGAGLMANGERLPTLISGHDYGSAVSSWAGLCTLAVNFTALAVVVTRLRARTLLQLWLAVAILGFALSTALVALARQRYSLGWYMAPLVNLAGTGAVLIALFHEMTLLYAKLVTMQAQLRSMVDVDGLTGLANRRHFNEVLRQQWLQAQRTGRPISVVMVDIDHFKAFNDALGHQAGDRCLQRVAGAVGGAVRRPLDLAARYGGEEFVLVLPETDAAGASDVAERLKKAIHDLQIPQPAEPGAYVHVSIGVATDAGQHGESDEALLARSDAALYRAKRAGRDRIVYAEPLSAPAPQALALAS